MKTYESRIEHEIVALCEEGVDRNSPCVMLNVLSASSPSAKRAWIEICLT